MAAVFALVFLFVLASIGLLFKVFIGGASASSIFAMLVFVAIGAGVFLALLSMARRWEGEADH